MKTGLRSLMLAALLSIGFYQISFSQCDVSNLYVQNARVLSSTATSCTVQFDATFDVQNNNGNKFIFIHAWLLQDYPNYFHCVDGHSTLPGAIRAPKADDLGNTILNLGINNDVTPPTILSTYPPDPTVEMATATSITRIVNPDGSATFVITGIIATLDAPCNIPQVIVADLWSSQSARAQVAHCVNCGITYSSGFFRAIGLANCATHTFNITLTNNTSDPISGTYNIYADLNGNGTYESSIDTARIVTNGSFNLAAGAGSTTTITGPVPAAYAGMDLFFVARITSGRANGAARVVLIPSTVCAPLPVTFQSFKAIRANSNMVNLRWQTATEINNSGFGIYRLTKGEWEYVTFVPSQAMSGNSSDVLTYTLSDQNNYKGITQYRIKQVDIDGKAKFSEIRAVRGDNVSEKVIIFPNPTINGSVTILFEDRDGRRDLSLIDNSGRMVQQWRNVSSNTLQVNDLKPGLYTLKILINETGFQTVQKIVVLQH